MHAGDGAGGPAVRGAAPRGAIGHPRHPQRRPGIYLKRLGIRLEGKYLLGIYSEGGAIT